MSWRSEKEGDLPFRAEILGRKKPFKDIELATEGRS